MTDALVGDWEDDRGGTGTGQESSELRFGTDAAAGESVRKPASFEVLRIRGHKFWIPEVLHGALSPLQVNQPAGFREQLD